MSEELLRQGDEGKTIKVIQKQFELLLREVGVVSGGKRDGRGKRNRQVTPSGISSPPVIPGEGETRW